MQIIASLSLCQLICRDNYKYEVTSPNGTQGSHEQLQLEVKPSEISCLCNTSCLQAKSNYYLGKEFAKKSFVVVLDN